MSGTHKYKFGYSKPYADNYENIFRKKRESAATKKVAEVEDALKTKGLSKDQKEE